MTSAKGRPGAAGAQRPYRLGWRWEMVLRLLNRIHHQHTEVFLCANRPVLSAPPWWPETAWKFQKTA